MSGYSRFSIFIKVISLSFCLSSQNIYAGGPKDEHADKTNECGVVLINVPSVLKPVGASNDTEMIETSAIDIPGVKKGVFSFPIDNERKKQIEIEYIFGDIDDMYFLSGIDFEFLKKVFDTIPAVLLSKLNKVTILFKKIVSRPSLVMEEIVDISHGEKESQLEDAQERSLASGMTLVVPYFSHGRYKNADFNPFYDLLVHQMRQTIGYVMVYHRYRDRTSGQQWRDAFLRDDPNLSSDMDLAEDFANAMALYLRTYGGFGYPDITGKYRNRFEILDGIMGLDFSERGRITERNRLLENQSYEINDLLKQLGIIDNEGVVYEGLDGNIPQRVRAFLPRHPNRLRMMKRIADKALALQKNGQLNFTSVREKLIRNLIWPGLFFVPQNEVDIPHFITDTVDLLDTLSDSEIEHRFYIFNEAIEFMERMDTQSLSNQEPYMVFERALREVQSRVN